MDQTESFLKSLTEANGIPGYESEVRDLLRDYMEPLGELSQDRLGSLVCKQPGVGPRVMLVGHMDEIGFMVTHVTTDGFLRFQPLGGWWDQVLLGHRVAVRTHRGENVTGVIGAKPPHLLSAELQRKLVTKKDMYIDIGVGSADEVRVLGVREGDPMFPIGNFEVLANGKCYLAKAFDNRIGCATVVEVLRHFSNNAHPNELYGVQSVQEEVGVRGATTSAHLVDPDVAIILESDIAGDVPGIKPEESSVKLGNGPTVMLYDRRMIPNLKLRDLIIDTAAALDIALQFSSMPGGATDGAAIHLHGTGVPTAVVGVPARHIHSHGSIIHREDYERAVQLVTAVVGKLDAETVASLNP